MKDFPKKHRKLFWLVIVLAILMPSISIGLALFVKDEYSRIIISDVSSPLYNLFATIALIFAAKQSSRISKRLALGWGILALAQFSFTLGDILWAVIELGLKSDAFPSIADGPYLLFYLIFFVGVILLPSKRVSPAEWLKRTLDLSIVMITAILGFWIFLIGPIIGTETTLPSLETFLSAAYPVGDLIMLFALLIIIYHRSGKFILGSIWILISGSIVMIITDSIFGYQSLLGTYTSGGILDLGWILAYLLIGFAGVYQAFAAQTYKEDATLPYKNLYIKEKISDALTYMPYIGIVGALYLLINYHHSKFIINSDALFISVGCINGLVIIRQIIMLNENKHNLSNLRKSLEQGKLQASELNKINQNLEQEVIRRVQAEKELKQIQVELEDRVEARTAELSRANVDLAHAMRGRDEFLANMSHELRTPLNAILGISESLEEKIIGPLNEKQEKYIRTINESGHHLLALINDILDLSKIEAGRMTLDLQNTSVDTIVQSALRIVKELAQKKNLSISYTTDNVVETFIMDGRRMKQVMVNLLSNAVKFTPQGGKIGLEINGDLQAGQMTLSVWDTGIGIKAEDISRLFQPFVQLDAGLNREHSGTGLGLAMVSQIVKLHGGRVEVESSPNRGSRFTIVLPWHLLEGKSEDAPAAQTTQEPNSKPRSQGKNGKILMVDSTFRT